VAQPRTLTCLSIAASDSSGGAGVQADLKAFAAAGCHGTCAITAITAQNTTGVQLLHTLPVEVVRAQIVAVLQDLGADAVKIGALGNALIVKAVADALREVSAPIVLDTVLGASADSTPLLDHAGRSALLRWLLPRATVITPNLAEAQLLAGTPGDRRVLAERLHTLGAAAVIVTGGHGTPVDHVYDGSAHVEIAVRRSTVAARHGTGCTHSALLAAYLAHGMPLLDAARAAAELTAAAVERGFAGIGAGEGPVDVLDVRRTGAQAAGDIQRRRTM
jgi:hydroxymethylpyrimidine/phosphomethylpyrimidine kinase